MEQQTFLATIRSALGRTRLHTASRTEMDVPGLFDSRAKDNLEEQDALLTSSRRGREGLCTLLETLRTVAAPLKLQIHAVSNIADAAITIATLATEIETEWGGPKQIAMHDHPLLNMLDLPALLEPEGIGVHIANAEDTPDNARQAVIASYIGITSAEWCVADCAAIALQTSPRQPRATSLVPSVHIAVIRLNQLLASLPELYAHLAVEKSLPNSFTFISGPSKTADIEACMVHGAHGPRAMHLVIVEE